jgi:hypothetical protein
VNRGNPEEYIGISVNSYMWGFLYFLAGAFRRGKTFQRLRYLGGYTRDMRASIYIAPLSKTENLFAPCSGEHIVLQSSWK